MLNKKSIFIVLVLLSLPMIPVQTGALVKFDFEQKFFNDPGQPVLDHFVLEKDGVYHLFYLRGNPARSIGRATTTDFIHWNTLEPVLEPGVWDDRALWAPHVVEKDGLWWMFYTGVSNPWATQRTGLALSFDLDNWYKVPWPVYWPDTSWSAWTDTAFQHGRDPHILEYNGKYYQFLTAQTKDLKGAIACAESNDLISWTDIGPLFVSPSWHVLESVFIMEYNGKFHLFFTEAEVYGTSHIASDSLFSGWDMANRRIIDWGHAPQITTLPSGEQMFSRHQTFNDNHGNYNYNLRFDYLKWVGDIPVPDMPWPLADQWNVVSGSAFAYQPTFGNNPWFRFEDVEATFEGDSWIGTKESFTGVLGDGYAGQSQGEGPTGVIRSNPFSITGNSMNLLVGGSNLPDECYVALVESGTGTVLYSETGEGPEEMTRRYWDIRDHKGKTAYIEIADLSTVGHINTDDIVESAVTVSTQAGSGGSGGKDKRRPLVAMSGSRQSREPVLLQNAPNPFNPSTSLAFEIPDAGQVELSIFDVNGRLVRVLHNGPAAAGHHSILWDGRDHQDRLVPSGIYFYRMSFANELVGTRKMIILK